MVSDDAQHSLVSYQLKMPLEWIFNWIQVLSSIPSLLQRKKRPLVGGFVGQVGSLGWEIFLEPSFEAAKTYRKWTPRHNYRYLLHQRVVSISLLIFFVHWQFSDSCSPFPDTKAQYSSGAVSLGPYLWFSLTALISWENSTGQVSALLRDWIFAPLVTVSDFQVPILPPWSIKHLTFVLGIKQKVKLFCKSLAQMTICFKAMIHSRHIQWLGRTDQWSICVSPPKGRKDPVSMPAHLPSVQRERYSNTY